MAKFTMNGQKVVSALEFYTHKGGDGVLGRIVDGQYTGYIVVSKRAVGLVSLNQASGWIWKNDDFAPTFRVEILPPGTRVTLEQEEV